MEMTEEELKINRALKQLMYHHINSKPIDAATTVDELKRFYYELVQFAQSKYPNMSAANMYHLRRQIINGICKTKSAWIGLVAVLELPDVSVKDMPSFDAPKPNVEFQQTHIFRATYGIKMPYIGGGSVVFSAIASRSPSTGSTSGSY